MQSNSVEKQIQDGQTVAKRLAQDLRMAQSSWAHFEAINGAKETSRRNFRDAGNWLRVTPNVLVGALVRDTVMSLSRIVDKSGKSSLCKIVSLLEKGKPSPKPALIARACELPKIGAHEERLIREKLQFFTDRVPAQWQKTAPPPPVPDLHKWRFQIEDLRDRVLAHSDTSTNLDRIQIDQIRKGFELISPLVGAAHYIFIGSLLPTTTSNDLTKKANVFWDYAQTGFIEETERNKRSLAMQTE